MAEERHRPPDGEPGDSTPTEPWPAPPPDSGAEPTAPAEPVSPAEPGAAEPTSPAAPTDPWASGDDTAVLPPVGADRWRARAGIPPAQPQEPLPAEPYLDETGGRWWAPPALALVALALLGLLGVGIWLVMRAGGEGTVPATVPSSPSSAPPTSRSATSAPATSAPSPTPSEPTLVAVPSVVGHLLADAQEILDGVGLNNEVFARVDPNGHPGTVVAAEPAPGTRVPLGSTVKLYVAVAPATTPPPQTASTPTASATPGPY